MKRNILLYFIFVTLFFFSLLVSYADVSIPEPTDTVQTYFKALKNGEVNIIKQCISGKIYERSKVLLEKNSSYPDFLRKFYRKADFVILNADEYDNDAVVDAKIIFQNGATSTIKLYLQKLENNTWKIVNESK